MYTGGAFDLFMFSISSCTSTLSRFFVLIIVWHQSNSWFAVRLKIYFGNIAVKLIKLMKDCL